MILGDFITYMNCDMKDLSYGEYNCWHLAFKYILNILYFRRFDDCPKENVRLNLLPITYAQLKLIRKFAKKADCVALNVYKTY